MKSFELQAAEARLEAAERQINRRLEMIDVARKMHDQKDLFVTEEANLCLLLSTITGKPNKYIEF
ncbi:hypothetical protein [Bacillus cereus]|uniref:hypothetical protein n=1 Tax=Bacillus cereus TaxID=1396 RepID=UPI0018795D64|nr:hypothetical protein [Bacillus cereus]MBE7096537.1 hypothetical protein [Bacillus cereus]